MESDWAQAPAHSRCRYGLAARTDGSELHGEKSPGFQFSAPECNFSLGTAPPNPCGRQQVRTLCSLLHTPQTLPKTRIPHTRAQSRCRWRPRSAHGPSPGPGSSSSPIEQEQKCSNAQMSLHHPTVLSQLPTPKTSPAQASLAHRSVSLTNHPSAIRLVPHQGRTI